MSRERENLCLRCVSLFDDVSVRHCGLRVSRVFQFRIQKRERERASQSERVSR